MFSLVIVTWNNFEQVVSLVESIRRMSAYDHEIIVVHNNRTDGNLVKDATNLVMGINVGLSKAANIGAIEAKSEYICLIDDDMSVCKDWDKYLLCTRKITKSNWICSTCVEPISPHYNLSFDDYMSGIRPTKWYRNISNTPLLIPTEFWRKIGGYDEDFPSVGAELGLAKRAFDHGEIDFIQVPYSLVLHYQSQSMKKMKGIKKARIDRDKKFYEKYGITRKKFIKEIGKGEVYDTTI